MKGKKTCKILKDIRRQIALDNDIELVISECTYQGDCLGTCPKCEAEVRYLERELEKRQRLGKVAMISGMALTTMLGLSSCGGGNIPQPTEGIVANPDTIEVEKLEGDVPYFPDSTDGAEEPLPIQGEEIAPLEGKVMAPESEEELKCDKDGLEPVKE